MFKGNAAALQWTSQKNYTKIFILFYEGATYGVAKTRDKILAIKCE